MSTQATAPAQNVANKMIASICMFMGASGRGRFQHRGVEGGGEALLLVVIVRPVPEPRTPDSGRAVAADQLAVGIFPEQIIEEEVLSDDDVAFEPQHLGDMG